MTIKSKLKKLLSPVFLAAALTMPDPAAQTTPANPAILETENTCQLDTPAEEEPAAREAGVHSIFSMNIKNLPIFYKGDVLPNLFPFLPQTDPQKLPPLKERAPCIGKIARAYDVVALQEAFRDTNLLHRLTKHKESWAPTFSRLHPSTIFSDIPKSPGLMLMGEKVSPGKAEPFETCSGWLSNGFDCFSAKGYQITERNGMHIVNTHMDAGGSDGDQRARAKQLKKLAAALPAGPLVVVGDFNVKDSRPSDKKAFRAFLKKTGLKIDLQNGVDFILSRDIDVTDKKIIPAGRLTDHDALTAKFRLPKGPKPGA
ncbi:MAG: hypothetical protein OXT65_07975 [Alphaproteobacteria bacterium]|nr:hypothetical protein [Alphaproteobacteria bacterium]